MYEVLEQDHYPSFVVSEIYIHQLMPEVSDQSAEPIVDSEVADMTKAGMTVTYLYMICPRKCILFRIWIKKRLYFSILIGIFVYIYFFQWVYLNGYKFFLTHCRMPWQLSMKYKTLSFIVQPPLFRWQAMYPDRAILVEFFDPCILY